MEIQLEKIRNDLNRHIEIGTPLEELLIKGRLLESDVHDAKGCQNNHMHWYRKVLQTYDPENDSVLLSEKGSRRLIDHLDTPYKKFSTEELYKESIIMNWKVRPQDYELC
ncbi:MAG: hypothetical protein KJ646_03275 [Nanoarchaeota archaeon]|nr:hypothetical protein [Nanoarchaeota archaeon]MBU4116261.1 hypothetical protein [Nanoarchaeota archaeon]